MARQALQVRLVPLALPDLTALPVLLASALRALQEPLVLVQMEQQVLPERQELE